MIIGTDGNDFEHRQRVAAHYQIRFARSGVENVGIRDDEHTECVLSFNTVSLFLERIKEHKWI